MTEPKDLRNLEIKVLSGLVQYHNRGLVEEATALEQLSNKLVRRYFETYPDLFMAIAELMRQGVHINKEQITTMCSKFGWALPEGDLDQLLFSEKVNIVDARAAVSTLEKESDLKGVLRGLKDLVRKLESGGDPSIAIAGATELFDRLSMGERLGGGLPKTAGDQLKMMAQNINSFPILPSGFNEIDNVLKDYGRRATLSIVAGDDKRDMLKNTYKMLGDWMKNGVACIICTKETSSAIILQNMLQSLGAGTPAEINGKNSEEISALISSYEGPLAKLIILDHASGSLDEGHLRQVGGTLRRRLNTVHLIYLLMGFDEREIAEIAVPLSLASDSIVLFLSSEKDGLNSELADIVIKSSKDDMMVIKNRLDFALGQ